MGMRLGQDVSLWVSRTHGQAGQGSGGAGDKRSYGITGAGIDGPWDGLKWVSWPMGEVRGGPGPGWAGPVRPVSVLRALTVCCIIISVSVEITASFWFELKHQSLKRYKTNNC